MLVNLLVIFLTLLAFAFMGLLFCGICKAAGEISDTDADNGCKYKRFKRRNGK